MRIGVVDADLIRRKRHQFPNLNQYPEIANYYFNIKWKSWS